MLVTFVVALNGSQVAKYTNKHTSDDGINMSNISPRKQGC